MNTKWILFGILSAIFLSNNPSAHALESQDVKTELEVIKKQNEKLRKDIQTIQADRDSILKQAKQFMAEKDAAKQELAVMQGEGAQTTAETDSLQKEIEILKSQLAQQKQEQLTSREVTQEQMKASEKRIADLEAEKNSLNQIMAEYTPVKIQELLEDRNRLQEETKRMATRVLDMEKRIEELNHQLKPLELDREEMHRLRTENKEMHKRMGYVSDLEKRQQQLLKENAEYREKVEVMKAKFKDAVPGLAKSGRISQKMMRENADMHYNLGTIFLHNKQFKEAIREYERVLELRPADPDTHYNLGVLYDDYLKDREKALHHYQKYLAISPRSPDAKKIESYILSLELEQKVR